MSSAYIYIHIFTYVCMYYGDFCFCSVLMKLGQYQVYINHYNSWLLDRSIREMLL